MESIFKQPLAVVCVGIAWITLSSWNLACDSATPPPSPSSSSTSTKSGTATNPDPDDPTNDDPSAPFDLCTTGLLVNSRLSEFSPYTKALCATAQLQALRKPENIFTGGDNKIIEKTKNLGDRSSSFTWMTSAVYDTDIESYWAMLRLQFLKPKLFSENFDRDPDTKVTAVQPSSDNSNVTFRYENSRSEGGKVDYIAKSELIQLARGKAYVVATRLTESKETLTDLKGLIVVNKIDDSTIEVLTTSYQQYSHASGQGNTYYDRALSSMRAEQKRAWGNAKNASKAKPLIDN